MDLAKFRSMVLVVALIAALMLVIVLAQQKRALLDRNEKLTSWLRYPYPGMYVPAMSVPSVRGDTVQIGSGGPGQVQVLFVFSTTCEFCEASLPAWKRIAGELAASAQVEVVGISVDSVQAARRYLAEHGIMLPVVSFTDRKLRALYRTVTLPQSIVLDGHGEVQYARLGAVTEVSAIDSIIQMSRRSGPWRMQLAE